MIGRRIYYDPTSGEVLQVTEEREGAAIQTSVDEDMMNYPALAGRSRSDVGVLELDYGEYHEEFELGRIVSVVDRKPVFEISPELLDPKMRQKVLQEKKKFGFI